MLLADRRRALLLGAWCSLWSVLGGMLGYAIGHLLQPVAWWLIDFYHMQADAQRFIAGFKHNMWLIALQGLTPIPYKIVTISAGIAGRELLVVHGVLRRHPLGALRGRGDAVLRLRRHRKHYLEKYLTPVLIGFFTLIVLGFVALHYLFK